MTHSSKLGTWTVLRENSDGVKAIVSWERDGYAVRDARGRMLGRYATVGQALDSVRDQEH